MKNILKIKPGSKPPGELALLAKASSVPIVRHIKIKADENPFDPGYQEYASTLKSASKQEKQSVLESHW